MSQHVDNSRANERRPDEYRRSTFRDPSGARFLINAHWLIRLRWVAIAGQLATVGVVQLGLGVQVPLLPLMVLIGIAAATNAALHIWHRLRAPFLSLHDLPPHSEVLLAGVLVLDLSLLTAMVFFTGGPSNPFSIFYFVNLALAAVILRPTWTWGLAVYTVTGFGGLFFFNRPLAVFEQTVSDLDSMPTDGQPLVKVGLFIAFSTCAFVIVYFVTRLSAELRRQEEQLRETKLDQLKASKFESLATLSAGAAHELATPLSTIAVIAKELERQISPHNESDETVQDVALIRAEVDRCRRILDRMSFESGTRAVDFAAEITAKSLIEVTLGELSRRQRVDTQYRQGADQLKVRASMDLLAQAMRGLLRNALDASAEDQHIALTVDRAGEALRIRIEDRGSGMDKETLERVSEPFFTTKEVGKGMGLGVFLARSVIERFEGSLRFESNFGTGTSAIIHLPLVDI